QAREEECLPEDQGEHAEIHGIADIPIRAAYDETPGRCHGRRRSFAFESKTRERVEKGYEPGDDQCGADDLQENIAGKGCRDGPAGDRPWNDPGDDPRSEEQKDKASDCGREPGHVPSISAEEALQAAGEGTLAGLG